MTTNVKRYTVMVAFNYVSRPHKWAADEFPVKEARQMEISLDGLDFADVSRVLCAQGFETQDNDDKVFVPGSQIITITEVRVGEKKTE